MNKYPEQVVKFDQVPEYLHEDWPHDSFLMFPDKIPAKIFLLNCKIITRLIIFIEIML